MCQTLAVGYNRDMETDMKIDVATLDAPQRRALEEVIGRELAPSQRLIISVIDVAAPAGSTPTPAQTLEDWTGVYDGLATTRQYLAQHQRLAFSAMTVYEIVRGMRANRATRQLAEFLKTVGTSDVFPVSMPV
jgi:ABC-type cobalamin transport system ATPase subunit